MLIQRRRSTGSSNINGGSGDGEGFAIRWHISGDTQAVDQSTDSISIILTPEEVEMFNQTGNYFNVVTYTTSNHLGYDSVTYEFNDINNTIVVPISINVVHQDGYITNYTDLNGAYYPFNGFIDVNIQAGVK